MSYKINKPLSIQERANFIVKYNHEQGLRIEETDKAMYALEAWELLEGDNVIDNTVAWEAEQEQAEKARIQELSMTRSDFFDGTIMAWGVGQDELLVLIQGLLATLPLEDVKKLIAINNFKNALNFYRKHDLFKMLVGYAIPLTETYQITITDDDLDKFFDEVDKGNKATAWEYLPKPVEIPIEPEEPPVSEDEITEDETTEEQITEE